jgi:hypothetical protein
MRKTWDFWLKANFGSSKRPNRYLTDNYRFFQPFYAHPARAGGIDEGSAIKDCPANLNGGVVFDDDRFGTF